VRLAAITLAHEYFAISVIPLKMFRKFFRVAKTFVDVVTCKIKHFYNIFTSTA